MVAVEFGHRSFMGFDRLSQCMSRALITKVFGAKLNHLIKCFHFWWLTVIFGHNQKDSCPRVKYPFGSDTELFSKLKSERVMRLNTDATVLERDAVQPMKPPLSNDGHEFFS